MARIPTFTKQEYKDFAAAIEDGSYFVQARKWYDVVYMSLMPERCFYIMLTSLAGIVVLLSLLALARLLPISPTEPLLFPMKNVTRDVPVISRIRTSRHQPVNDALQRYFLEQYVQKRENYSFDTVQSAFRFIKYYSDEGVLKTYRRYIDPTSARSPINRYERTLTRDIDVLRVRINRIDGETEDWQKKTDYIATVLFDAYVIGTEQIEATRWKAMLEFEYDPLIMNQPEDLKNGELKVDPMTFSVTDYTVTEILSNREE